VLVNSDSFPNSEKIQGDERLTAPGQKSDQFMAGRTLQYTGITQGINRVYVDLNLEKGYKRKVNINIKNSFLFGRKLFSIN